MINKLKYISSHIISRFDLVTNKIPDNEINWNTVLEEIKSGKHKAPIEKCRALISNPVAYREEKKKLPAVTFSGTFSPSRNKNSLKRGTGFIVADVDHIDDVERIFRLLIKDKYVYFVFRSPSGEGLKVGLRAKGIHSDAEHKAFYFAIERYFLDVYDIKIDPACKDISRLTFLSYDPELFKNENATYFPIKKLSPTQPEFDLPPLNIGTNTIDAQKFVGDIKQQNPQCIDRLKASLPRIESVLNLKLHSGVEMCGPCPRCGGDDRFVAFTDTQKFWCRQVKGCGWRGDAIDFFKNHHGEDLPGLFERYLKDSYKEKAPTDSDVRKATNFISMADIIKKDFPEPVWLIEGYLPSGGVCLLGGKPKAGKSLLALNIAIAVATGGEAIGNVKVKKGTVLLLALEDTPRRLKDRVKKMTASGNKLNNIIVRTDIKKFKAGGESELEDLLQHHKPVLVIVDTLIKIRASERGRGNKLLYTADYEAMEAFIPFAKNYNCTFIVVTHLRKMEAEDPFDTFSGSLGLTAPADTLWVLQRQRRGIILSGRGRDMEPFGKALQFDSETLTWRILGNIEDIQKSPSQQKIYDVLKESTKPLQPKEISDLSGVGYEVVKHLLRNMLADCIIDQVNEGYYINNHSLCSPSSLCTPHTPHSPVTQSTHPTDRVNAVNGTQKGHSPIKTNNIIELKPRVNAVNGVNGMKKLNKRENRFV